MCEDIGGPVSERRRGPGRAPGTRAINTNSLRIVNSKRLNDATLVSPPLLTNQPAAVLQCGRKARHLFIGATDISGTR